MSQFDKITKGSLLQNPQPQVLANPKDLSWGVVALVSVVGAAVLVLPDPVPGSGLVAAGMVAATWWSKLGSYGVSK